MPYDIPIPGYGTNTVNYLRLWESRASEEFDFAAFNRGGYVEAVREKNARARPSRRSSIRTTRPRAARNCASCSSISSSPARCSDIIRRFRKHNDDWDDFPDKVAIQLNDTHPAIAVVELMRLLHDEYGMPWEHAWAIVTRTFAYTNHTLLPEALEKWSVRPVSRKSCRATSRSSSRSTSASSTKWRPSGRATSTRSATLSLIEEGHAQMVRMAHLAVVGSHSVNGVAALHTAAAQKRPLPRVRRALSRQVQQQDQRHHPAPLAARLQSAASATSSPRRSAHGWERDLDKLRGLEAFADDPQFQHDFMADQAREQGRPRRASSRKQCGVEVNPAALFDVQIKRLHEYKRQHLNLLHILALYRRLLQNPDARHRAARLHLRRQGRARLRPGQDASSRRSTPSARRINADPRIDGKLKVVFLPNYRVSLAQRIVPAADLSEQISTAGKEASGTGNMKLALNGALTIGTLDGANVEIREEVGEENIFIFGLTVEEVAALWKKGYKPAGISTTADEELRAVVDWVGSNYFTPDEPPACLNMLRDNLVHQRPLPRASPTSASYSDAPEEGGRRLPRPAALGAAWRSSTPPAWASSPATARSREYASEIWKLKPVPV